jgi:hypothetical protein
MGAVGDAFGGMSVEDDAAEVGEFLAEAQHPTLGRPYRDCGCQPMVELPRYLEVHGFSTFIASGGDATSCGRSRRRSTATPPSG